MAKEFRFPLDMRDLQIRAATSLLDFLTEERGIDAVAVQAAFFAGAGLATFDQDACIEACRRSAADGRVPPFQLEDLTEQVLRWAIERQVRR